MVAKSFNRKVYPRYFEVNDLVLRNILPIVIDPRGKFTPNYSGPYVVKKILSRGALILAEMEGQEFANPVNADAMKKIIRDRVRYIFKCLVIFEGFMLFFLEISPGNLPI